MRRQLALLLAGAALAGCGSPPPDLFEVQRSGSDPNANVDVVVSDGGSVTCNGKEHPLDADRLLTARQLQRDLAKQAELGIQLPQGANGELAYKVRMEAGSLAFGDESAQIPKTFLRLAAFTADVTEHVCKIER
jgi:hypothetical protein